MLVVEPFKDQYKEQVFNLILDIQINEFSSPIGRKDQPDLEDVKSFYQQSKGNFWVAKLDNNIVGTIGLIDIDHDQGALRKMFVSKDHRGKEKGVANQLLGVMLQWSKVKYIKEIYLGTRSVFLSAHRFYEKNGFVEIEKESLPKNFPIMAVDTKFYSYNITNNEKLRANEVR
ncbi:GNAT family N-acetyltransferase [Legionella sainthelensi]|uniref:GNAT family N-acetyltransferase n=1 Tax=Legionella sainthelensi TaxID=28087 RepID=A0A2H5FPH8_9GAMM|nr:GNAT family N-acetyltransferase [Legionella sainthelensi]AUH73488.1 N-acetyltransferase [Legionella sainthelensi]